MKDEEIDDLVADNTQEIEYVIKEVAVRGYIDAEEEMDCYMSLRTRREFRDLIIGEIYESYFLPERHEFDWHIIQQVVDVMTNIKIYEFIALAVAGGVVGNAAYEVLKKVLKRIVDTMRKAELPESRYGPYEQMISNIVGIREYFETKECAYIREVETDLSIPREQVYPFLKLLGFSHHRRKNNCLWCKP